MRHLVKNSLLILILLLLSSHVMAAGQVGESLLPFKGTDLNGQPYDLQPIIGSKPVILVFRASWCPACRVEVPKINQLVKKYRAQGLEFLSVNVGYNDSTDRAGDFVRKNGLTYPTYFDGSHAMTQKYGVTSVPTIIVADRRGTIHYRNNTAPTISESQFTALMAK